MSIIDKRFSNKGSSFPNRDRFIKKYKATLKKNLIKNIQDIPIKNFNFKNKKIKISGDDLETDAALEYDHSTGITKRVFPGNKKFSRGVKLEKDSKSASSGSKGSPSGSGNDDFIFTLTEKEFADLFFEDLELPDLIKKSFMSNSVEYKKSGFCKYGNINLLNIKRTLINALARRKAFKKLKKKSHISFLEKIDLRYNYIQKQDVPGTNAVMFCLLDVSGSMGEKEKDLAKRFFILLNLFLRKYYENVEVVFVRHAEYAEEVNEDEFFYGTKSGGTVMSTGYVLINNIISSRYNVNDYNIYIAQASDGDNWTHDIEPLVNVLQQSIFQKIQHLFYIQIDTTARAITSRDDSAEWTVLTIYQKLKTSFKALSSHIVTDYKDIFPVFKDLFRKKPHVK